MSEIELLEKISGQIGWANIWLFLIFILRR